MLEIKKLVAGYERIKFIDGVSLRVKPNEIVGIIGTNGSGKSTVLKSVFGLADFLGGKITFDSVDLTKLKTNKLISLGISYVPQGIQIFPNMTVLENLELGGFSVGGKIFLKKDFESIFEEFPMLESKKFVLAGNLSGGQQHLLAIARALMQKPKLLLLDEPSIGLDPNSAKEVFDKIAKIEKNGVAILIVEQNVKKVMDIADRIYVLENGKIALEAGSDDILQNDRIKKIYFGQE